MFLKLIKLVSRKEVSCTSNYSRENNTFVRITYTTIPCKKFLIYAPGSQNMDTGATRLIFDHKLYKNQVIAFELQEKMHGIQARYPHLICVWFGNSLYWGWIFSPSPRFIFKLFLGSIRLGQENMKTNMHAFERPGMLMANTRIEVWKELSKSLYFTIIISFFPLIYILF